jgi:hypothetical protein
LGDDNDATSVFLPQVAKRMVALYPRLAYLRFAAPGAGNIP